jgi:hypothetical protein
MCGQYMNDKDFGQLYAALQFQKGEVNAALQIVFGFAVYQGCSLFLFQPYCIHCI